MDLNDPEEKTKNLKEIVQNRVKYNMAHNRSHIHPYAHMHAPTGTDRVDSGKIAPKRQCTYACRDG